MQLLTLLMLSITLTIFYSCDNNGTGSTGADSVSSVSDTGSAQKPDSSKMPSDTTKTRTATTATSANTEASPVLVKLDGRFETTTEDKDWDTELGIRINKNGRVVAEKFCCSGARDNDHYADGYKSPAIHVDVYQTDPTTKADLDNAVLILSAQASQRGKGNDHWRFNYTMKATFSDNSTRNWTITGVDINSEKSMRTEAKYDLYKYHD